MKRAGGDAQRPVAEDDDLLGAVGRRHAHAAFAAQLVGRALDVGVGSLSLFRVDDLDAVHRLHAAGVALDLVGIEHHDDAAFAKALIVCKNVDERTARSGNVLRGKALQLVPGKNNVVAVNEQIFRVLGVDRHVVVVGKRGARGLFRRLERAALYLAVGALEDLLQLLVRCIRAACANAAARRGSGFLLGFLFVKVNAAVAVDMLRDFIPRNGDAAAVVAENGGGGIICVALGVVAKGRDDLILILAGLIPAHSAGELSAAAGVGRDVGEIVAQRAHRRITREYGVFPHALRGIDRSAHVLEVGHRAADTLGGNFKTEVIVRFKKQAFRLHQALPHGAIGCLTKIAALGVL